MPPVPDHLVNVGTGGPVVSPAPMPTYVAGIEFPTDVKRRCVV
jgi:hypothetical protein